MDKKVDRKTILSGDITIWLKDKRHYLNEECEICPVEKFVLRKVQIIEKDGRCYAAIPVRNYSLTGMLYETRDSFDELVAQYQKDNAGGNASETEE